MFSEPKKDKKMNERSASQNIISQDTKFVGDITSEGDFRIDGNVEGNLNTSGKIVVGKSGFVNGTINGSDAYFEGKFKGQLNLSGTLTLKDSAVIEGEVLVNKLVVEPGAVFNVTCTMKNAVKDLKNNVQPTKSA